MNIYAWIYLVLIVAVSVPAVILAVRDKRAAEEGERRVPEKVLMSAAALGGASAMLAAMLIIRHKTAHMKFMLGLPLLALLHAGIMLLLLIVGR